MAKYESEVKMVPQATCEQVYQKLSNLETFRPIIDNAANNPMIAEKLREAGQDPSKLEALKEIELTSDQIIFPVPMLGNMELHIVEREENRCIKLQTGASPIDGTLWVQVLPVSAGGSKMRVTLQADLNMMMKMMVGKKLEKGVDEMANILAQLPYNMM